MNIPSDPVAKIFGFKELILKSTTGAVCPLIKGISGVILPYFWGSITATAPPPLVNQEIYNLIFFLTKINFTVKYLLLASAMHPSETDSDDFIFSIF